MTNDDRRQILNRAKSLNYPGSILEVFQAYSQGVDVLSDFEREQRAMQNQQAPLVAQTPQEQSQGLIPFHQQGMTNQSMVFPDVKPGQPFTTQGLTAPIDMTKVDNQGNVVESYKAVQPGIANIPTGPYEGTMIETPAKSYLKGGFIKKYQVAGFKSEEDETVYNEKTSRYGKNTAPILSRKEVTASVTPPELIESLKSVQDEINLNINSADSGSRKNYEARVLDSINRLGEIDISETGYMPEDVKQAAYKEGRVPYYCISGACYALGEAGEDLKYYSNSKLQEDIETGKIKDWKLNFDTKNIRGGDIVQFTGNRTRAHHAGLVVPNSIRYEKDGSIIFDAYMNSGDGKMYIRKDYKLDPKTDKVETGLTSETIQLVTKAFDEPDPELVSKRKAIKEEILKYDPKFEEGENKTIRYNTFSPDQIEQVATGSNMQYRDLNFLTRVGGGDEIDKVGRFLGKNMSYQEFADKAKFEPILEKVNSPEFKKEFMEKYNISNEEYNASVLTSLGIYGQETGFGFKTKKYKENNAVRKIGAAGENLLRIATGKEKRSTDQQDFSRGLTQVKLRNISEEDRKKYNITEKSLEKDPTSAIVAAMIVNAQNMPTLRKIASDGRNQAVTEENYLDYLPYLYNQRGAILRGDEENKKRASKKARQGRQGVEADQAANKAASESIIINPNDIGANNEYVTNVNTFSKLFEVMPSTISPIEIKKKKQGGAKCYTCGGLKAKVGYNKLGYKK